MVGWLLHINIKYIYDLSTHFVINILKWAWAPFCTQLNGFKYCYVIVTIWHVICLHTVCSIWPIDRILSSATTLSQSGPGTNGNEGYSTFLKSPPSLNLHSWCLTIQWFNIILFTNPSARAGYDTRSIFKWSLTSLNSEFSFSWFNIISRTLIGGSGGGRVFFPYRDAVSVFYNPSQLGWKQKEKRRVFFW